MNDVFIKLKYYFRMTVRDMLRLCSQNANVNENWMHAYIFFKLCCILIIYYLIRV